MILSAFENRLLHNYFSTIGEKLDEELSKKTSNFNNHDFKSYCHKPHKIVSLLHLQSTECFDKLLEKLVFNRLISYLERNSILYQFGFRKKALSTSLALIDVVGNIYQNLDASLTVVGIYLDLTKGFDTVTKLQNYKIYGIRGIAYHWFKSYLCNRQQFTIINNVSSCFTYVPCRVPQGSTLGPLLLLLYVNDISHVLSGENVKLFADGTNLFTSGVDIKLEV